MRLSPYRLAVPGTLLLLLVQAVEIHGVRDASIDAFGITARAFDSLDNIDTEGDKELEEWLDANKRLAPEVLKTCPSQCSQTHNSTTGAGWFLFPDTSRLVKCNETMLLDLVIKNKDTTAIRACTADYDSNIKSAYRSAGDQAALCPTPNHDMIETSVRMSSGFPGEHDLEQVNGRFSSDHVLSAGHQMTRFLATQMPSCTQNIALFGYSQSAVVGIFAGVELHQHGLTAEVLDKLLEWVEKQSISKTTVLQLCPIGDLGADYTLGIVVTEASNLRRAQETVASWATGKCSAAQGEQDWLETTVRVPSVSNMTSVAKNETTKSTHFRARAASILSVRAECKTTTVNAGDGCWAVANRCGISQDDLVKYNTRTNFCNTLVAGEKVCCSSGTLPSNIPPANSDGSCVTKQVQGGDICETLASKCGLSLNDFMKVNTKENLCNNLHAGNLVCCSNGKLPDRRPKPEADGTCASYKTNKDDSCDFIAASRDLTIQDLENFNKKTWGWTGCDVLWLGFRLCVSEGNPPMPEAVSNAVCGPTVPGSMPPALGVELASLNPCPLKACCNVWGQCGLSEDFCLVSPSKSGAPGTSGLPNGCVYNCGMDIIKGSPPASKINIAYFEAWNSNRPCLIMDVDMIDTSKYTHVHFSFAELTADFKVNITSVTDQFERFKGMSGVKKVISFGGWDFSALPGTYNILREAVKPENRDTFKNNVVEFVNQHNLDGVDIDWEYPGAPDIPDIPADDPNNGVNYYKFLVVLKSALGSSKSVSFAAPSSYWYLRAYPVLLMARSLDYIVFMTYDLHGQWDYGNKWTSPGCPTGNCLRSHVNDTETKSALAMITKAGVASNKVVVGVASYGRSFKMEAAGCDGPLCKFTGSPRESNAAKGRCTGTAGYISNAEIAEIIASGKANKQWTEAGSNIMVYNNTEWVAYMNDDMKALRAKDYDTYNFAGITDWAVDLQAFRDNGGSGGDDDDYEQEIDINLFPPCGGVFSSLDSLEKSKDTIAAHCVEKYLVQVEVAILEAAWKKYNDLVNGGYDGKFKIYERYVKDQVPLQVNAFMASDEVQKYFKCTQYGNFQCCGSCRYFCDSQGDCQNFPGCKDGVGTVDIKCPQIEHELDFLDSTRIPNATFSLTDKDGFWKAIGDKYGIEESWVNWGRRHMRTSNGCQYTGEDIKHCIDTQDSWWYNYPNGSPDKVQVYNPKDLVSNSYNDTKAMLGQFQIIRDFAGYNDVLPWSDAVDAMALPPLSLQTAVESMQDIVDKANEIEEKEREEFILSMIMGILFFIPFAGEGAAAVGLTAARSLIRLIGDVGELGLAVYSVVKEPETGFNAVFGFLLGKALDKGALTKAANAKRGMKSNELDNLVKIKTDLARIKSARVKVCTL